ncbi:Alanine_aminotransferase [Hexamita inflata]|uniref:Putative n=1 Tax=Hexamita inflata TaxID=28002 RepID=A0ABP1H4Q2_9EUKA
MPQPIEELNQAVIQAEYAVRGAVVIRAGEIAADMKKNPSKYKYNRISYLNIGNPMASGLTPMKFTRDLISLCIAPHLLNNNEEDLLKLGYSQAVIERARLFMKQNPTGLGPYTHSKGYASIRQEVADFIKQRDGFECDPEHIFLSNGASSAIKDCIQLLAGPSAGKSAFMIPIPQYPLYSATLVMNSAMKVGYELDEANNWTLDVKILEKVYQTHQVEHPEVKIRALIVINPSNPCGAVLPGKIATEVIDFCAKHDIALFADEVYQENLYHPTKEEERSQFVSFKKTLREYELKNKCAGPMLLSFHSVSKGFTGECGLRGGYMEVVNAPAHIQDQLYKVASVSLCSNSIGQLAVSVMVNPPALAEYVDDAANKIATMERKAQMTYQILNANKHIDCQKVQGAMYAFPTLELPEAFVTECQNAGKLADNVYCMRLLEEEGICCVSGSGFLQKKNTWHLRMNILEQEELMPEVCKKMSEFHDRIWNQYQK